MKELSSGATGFHRIVLESNHICELREKQKFSLGGLEWNKENEQVSRSKRTFSVGPFLGWVLKSSFYSNNTGSRFGSRWTGLASFGSPFGKFTQWQR